MSYLAGRPFGAAFESGARRLIFLLAGAAASTGALIAVGWLPVPAAVLAAVGTIVAMLFDEIMSEHGSIRDRDEVPHRAPRSADSLSIPPDSIPPEQLKPQYKPKRFSNEITPPPRPPPRPPKKGKPKKGKPKKATSEKSKPSLELAEPTEASAEPEKAELSEPSKPALELAVELPESEPQPKPEPQSEPQPEPEPVRRRPASRTKKEPKSRERPSRRKPAPRSSASRRSKPDPKPEPAILDEDTVSVHLPEDDDALPSPRDTLDVVERYADQALSEEPDSDELTKIRSTPEGEPEALAKKPKWLSPELEAELAALDSESTDLGVKSEDSVPASVDDVMLVDEETHDCTSCGTANPARARFCKKCSRPMQPWSCEKCGFVNDVDATFCMECREPLQMLASPLDVQEIE